MEKLLNSNAKAKISAVIILAFLVIVTISKGIAAAGRDSEKYNIRDSFYQSVNYSPEKALLNFTIPKTVPEGAKFYLHVSGRIFMDNKSNAMSFHAFDKESETFSWEKGKTYSYLINSENLDECLLVYGLIDNNNKEVLYNIHILPDGSKKIESDN